MMIERNQSRLCYFENATEYREISHGGCLETEKEKQTQEWWRWTQVDSEPTMKKKIIQFCKNNKIHAAMLSETNGKCRTRTADTMSSKMK